MINVTETYNISRPYQLIDVANSVTGDLFGLVMVICVFIIAFISLKDWRSAPAFAASSFITTLIAILLRTLNALADWAVFICIFLTIIGLAFLIFNKWE